MGHEEDAWDVVIYATDGLIDTLQGIRRRVRVLSVLYGVGIVVAAIPCLLLGTVLLDYF